MRVPTGLAAVTLSLLLGCGGGGAAPVSPTSPQPAVLALAFAPTPLAAAPCSGCGGGSAELEAAGVLTIRESAGVAATVDSIPVVLRSTASGAVLAQGEFGPEAVTALAGTRRLAGGGTLTATGVGVHFSGDVAAALPGTLTLTVNATDDGGRRVSSTTSVAVTRATP